MASNRAIRPVSTLVLFSDGTGNSSAKLFKTNIWRMYESVDLGPSVKGEPVQVAYYDNGIGTQSIKALALLAGVFGIGLRDNVLRLYRFACRNGSAAERAACAAAYAGSSAIALSNSASASRSDASSLPVSYSARPRR